MNETQERLQRQEKLAIEEPQSGWSRQAYTEALDAYVAERGREPQTITMHPETMAALGLSDEAGATFADTASPMLVTSRDYPRSIITLYY
jgi:hypothetical protein